MSEYSAPTQFIDLSAQQQVIREKLEAAILKVLDHGQYIMGPEVKDFENSLVNFLEQSMLLPAQMERMSNTRINGLGYRSRRCSFCSCIYICCIS